MLRRRSEEGNQKRRGATATTATAAGTTVEVALGSEGANKGVRQRVHRRDAMARIELQHALRYIIEIKQSGKQREGE